MLTQSRAPCVLSAGPILYSFFIIIVLCSYESGHSINARSFNLCYRYIDDLIVFNDKKFIDHVKDFYPS